MEKFLIRFENKAVGLRYNLATGAVLIGGSLRDRGDIEMFIAYYFGSEAPVPEIIQKRKIKYRLKMKKKVFDAGLKLLRDNDLLEKVRVLGRIMQ